MRVREARADELVPVRSILDAAMLEVPDLDESTVLVAVEEGRVLGALALHASTVQAVAVRPGRRGQGIGRALVEAAAERRDELTAEFDERARSFYESLGFAVRGPDLDGRFEGRLG